MPIDPVVRDGRVDEEKVAELRGIGGESEALDFKRTADLGTPRTKLAIVKDIVSLANTGGGFLVVGCDEQGQLATDMPELDPLQWEPANLMGIVAKYVSAPIALNAQTHSIDGRTVAIVAVLPTLRDLPVPFAADGEWYDEDRKPRYEFRKGQLWIRNGPRNATLDFHDWDRVLELHDETIRERTRGENRDLIDQVLAAIRNDRDDDPEGSGGQRPNGPRGPSPLVPGMSWDSLDRGVDQALDSTRDTSLRRYVNELGAQIADPDADRGKRQRAITEIANLAIRSDAVDRGDVVEIALDALHRVYGALDERPAIRYLSGVRDEAITNYWLDIATRVLDLGAYFVRNEKWAEVRSCYARVYDPEGDGGYVFQSWLRHAQVQGSRAEILRGEDGRDGGAIYLSFAREVAVAEPRLRPDIRGAEPLAIGSAPQGRDQLLDSLAQFDALCTVMSEARVTEGHAGHYPSFASLRSERVEPVLTRIATDSQMRSQIFPSKSDAEIADALVRTLEAARSESWRSAGVWFVPSGGPLGTFIASNRTDKR